jgi:hypothetical protein
LSVEPQPVGLKRIDAPAVFPLRTPDEGWDRPVFRNSAQEFRSLHIAEEVVNGHLPTSFG